ncbi:MAG: class A beta-lactamase-related serine hydrolase [Gemmatimonadales bacterium]|nr:MAG: class A beta-lactamase-related serine hydrolase [Gemmatimonadales bacterium]
MHPANRSPDCRLHEPSHGGDGLRTGMCARANAPRVAHALPVMVGLAMLTCAIWLSGPIATLTANPSPGATVAGQVADPLATRLQEAVPRLMARHGVTGVNLVVLREGREAWAASFGSADSSRGRPMTREALFRVESISKPVTAWGVMRLVEEGRVRLDDPVSDHLHSWSPPPQWREVTIRHLLSHTGGLAIGDFTDRFPPEGPVRPLRESISRDLEVVAPPGQGFEYSNVGFNILEVLVEDVTGEPFSRWMADAVLRPLGMETASFHWTGELAARMPVGHDLKGEPVAAHVYPGRASGGLLGTVDDIARFAAAGMDPPFAPRVSIPSPSGRAHLYRTHAPVEGVFRFVADGYALGYFTETLSDGRRAVWHGGQGNGWMTHLHVVPESGDAVVILANSQRAWPLFGHILRAWSDDLGVEPVGMSVITRASPLAWAATLLLGLAAGVLALRLILRRRPASLFPRLVTGGAGLVLLLGVGWAAAQDYLFLFSILPGQVGWLGAAVGGLGVVLLLSALVRPFPPRAS